MWSKEFVFQLLIRFSLKKGDSSPPSFSGLLPPLNHLRRQLRYRLFVKNANRYGIYSEKVGLGETCWRRSAPCLRHTAQTASCHRCGCILFFFSFPARLKITSIRVTVLNVSNFSTSSGREPKEDIAAISENRFRK